jgi:hypothetical protein
MFYNRVGFGKTLNSQVDPQRQNIPIIGMDQSFSSISSLLGMLVSVYQRSSHAKQKNTLIGLMLKLTKKSQHVLQDLLSLIKPIISA